MIIYVICVFFVSLQQNVMNMALNLNKNLKLYYMRVRSVIGNRSSLR